LILLIIFQNSPTFFNFAEVFATLVATWCQYYKTNFSSKIWSVFPLKYFSV
jgi:hypothetical protein